MAYLSLSLEKLEKKSQNLDQNKNQFLGNRKKFIFSTLKIKKKKPENIKIKKKRKKKILKIFQI